MTFSTMAIISKVQAAITMMDAHQGFCMVLLTAALALCGLVSCALAYKSIKAMKESELERARPMVVLESVKDIPFYGIRMKNTGLTAAHNISVNIAPSLESYLACRRKGKMPIRFLNQLIAFFPPSASIETLVGTLDEIRQANASMIYQGTIRYADAKGRRYEDAFALDYSLYTTLIYSGKKTIHDIQVELEKMRRVIEHVGSGFYKLRVITQNIDDYREEERQQIVSIMQQIEEDHRGTNDNEASGDAPSNQDSKTLHTSSTTS